MKTRLVALGAVVAGTALAATALTATAQAAPAAPDRPAAADYTPPPVSWSACTNATLKAAKAQCGFVTVPLDYDRPTGTKIKLAVSRVEHSSDDYQGVMLVNPGGPGGSGLIYSILGGTVPKKAGLDYDWIGFDPRGVGASTPSLSCDPNYAGLDRPLYEPRTAGLEKAWLKKASAYAADCRAADGAALLDHLKSTDNARDMDSIRKALGRKQINFYGFSYGTYLAQVYSTLFPGKLRRTVMDGVVNPDGVWYRDNIDQDIAFEKTVNIYFAWLAKYDSVYHLGKTAKAVSAMYYDQRKKLDASPAGGSIGPDEWTDIFNGPAYYVYGWQDVAEAVAAWVNDKDPKGLIDAYGFTPDTPEADNGYAVYLGTQCTDNRWPGLGQFEADNARVARKAPYLTWSNGRFNLGCVFWKGDTGRPVHVTGTGAPKALLISETYDAATPFSGALKVRSRFGGSALIEGVGGSTHAGSLSGIACTDNAIADYLLDGSLPKRKAGDRADKACPPVPQPDPTAKPATPAGSSGGAARQVLRAARASAAAARF